MHSRHPSLRVSTGNETGMASALELGRSEETGAIKVRTFFRSFNGNSLNVPAVLVNVLLQCITVCWELLM